MTINYSSLAGKTFSNGRTTMRVVRLAEMPIPIAQAARNARTKAVVWDIDNERWVKISAKFVNRVTGAVVATKRREPKPAVVEGIHLSDVREWITECYDISFKAAVDVIAELENKGRKFKNSKDEVFRTSLIIRTTSGVVGRHTRKYDGSHEIKIHIYPTLGVARTGYTDYKTVHPKVWNKDRFYGREAVMVLLLHEMAHTVDSILGQDRTRSGRRRVHGNQYCSILRRMKKAAKFDL